MSRGGFKGGKGFGKSQTTGANSIIIPDNLVVSYRETPLYPEIEVKAYRPATEYEAELAHTTKRFKQNAKDSLFYIGAQPEAPGMFCRISSIEVERYSHKYLAAAKKDPFKTQIGKISLNLDFFPEELLSSISSGKKRKSTLAPMVDLDLSKIADQLEKEELQGDSAVSKDGEQPNDSDDPDEFDDEFDDEDGENDYGIDYYDEDQDAFGSDGGGD
ncbi:hypothetical protein HDV03_002291 [Kappamyces sp. JEL0829]|nr:hypothetical protein HDV03_002291 [Kappamyces sp. JEL0829]